MSQRSSILFALAILCLIALASAARLDSSLENVQKEGVEKSGVESIKSCEGMDEEECLDIGETENSEVDEEGMNACEGMEKEECLLMRRALIAHTDYIYTQRQKP
ncbi:hypothetical protein M9H77_32353 [Catharanthus roseus]|uniref:Uncharacterized protein n=1 Tax=Catharanthus roseus TaxID=4058 RepID=A0ACC0A335_CATRO|nr:hypothetical protein M9H77_32353 [Catharanthus roseus]